KENRAAEVGLSLPTPPSPRWAPVRAWVRALRRAPPPTVDDIAALGRATGLELVIVLHGDVALGFARYGATWRFLGRGPNASAVLAALPGSPAPAPTAPTAESHEGRSPWIYVIAGGAAAIAAGLVVLATRSTTPTQRIEVTWPPPP